MAKAGHPLARPASEDELKNPLKIVDEIGWLGGEIRGQRVLCLAAGGGRHSALYAAAGASVTIVDLSPAMLELDRIAARQHHFEVRLIEASMTDMRMLQQDEFDIVIHPVSTCYIADIHSVFREVARVLRPGGLYVSQHKQPINLQTSLVPTDGKYQIESPGRDRTCANQPMFPNRLRETGTVEFVHSLQTLLGGMCRSGFVIEDFAEPQHGKLDSEVGSFAHRCAFVPPYIRVKARRKGELAKRSLVF